jgi:hypothetical protein
MLERHQSFSMYWIYFCWNTMIQIGTVEVRFGLDIVLGGSSTLESSLTSQNAYRRLGIIPYIREDILTRNRSAEVSY